MYVICDNVPINLKETIGTACKATNVFLMAQLCIVLKKIKYVNLPCLFSVVLCGLGEATIPSVS